MGRGTMAKRNSSNPANPSDLGFDAHVFDNDDIFRLLKDAVKSEGGQTVFAKRHRINRVYVNMVLKGKRPVGDSIARTLGLRKVYIAE
jgi:hypothetical protein